MFSKVIPIFAAMFPVLTPQHESLSASDVILSQGFLRVQAPICVWVEKKPFVGFRKGKSLNEVCLEFMSPRIWRKFGVVALAVWSNYFQFDIYARFQGRAAMAAERCFTQIVAVAFLTADALFLVLVLNQHKIQFLTSAEPILLYRSFHP